LGSLVFGLYPDVAAINQKYRYNLPDDTSDLRNHFLSCLTLFPLKDKLDRNITQDLRQAVLTFQVSSSEFVEKKYTPRFMTSTSKI